MDVSSLDKDLAATLLTEAEIQARVGELAREIERDYVGRDLLLVGVLKGAVTFLVDLAREVRLPLELDFMATSSYGASTRSSGIVRILKDLDEPIEGKEVLVVEDIVDSGLTLGYILRTLRMRQPASIKVCGLLVKDRQRAEDVQVDYVGFDIPDRFVVGYGLDYAETYRNLPYVAALKPSLYRDTAGGTTANQ